MISAVVIVVFAHLPGGVAPPLVSIAALIATATRAEPPIAEVQAQALQHARLNEGRLEGLRAGASWKAALPVLEVSGGYSQTRLDEDTILDEYSSTDPWVIRGAGGNAAEVRVKLSWDLARLAYNGETLDVLALQGQQEDVVTRVTQLYGKRRRLLVELAGELSDEDEMTRRLALDETTALLSAATGGWFAAQLVRP